MSDDLSPPFSDCPRCNNKSYGILAIYPELNSQNSILAKGCSYCRHHQLSNLPHISKKIIYLDQNAISNLQFAANTNSPKHQKAILDGWQTLFNKLNKLIKYNLIICPYSDIHVLESVPTTEFHNLQHFQEILSGMITFSHHNLVEDIQVKKYFKNYILGKIDSEALIEEIDCFDIYPHSWYMKSKAIDEFRLDFPLKNEEVEEVKNANIKAHNQLEESTYLRWKNRDSKKFEELVLEEATAFGNEKLWWFAKYYRYIKGLRENTAIEEMVKPPAFDLISELIKIAKSNSSNIILKDFFNSKSILNVPCIRISSEYFASIARKLNKDSKNRYPRKSNPSPGMLSDSVSLSTFLPYCDAFFTDNENYALFQEKPLKIEKKKYNTEIFSKRNMDEFIEYLENIWLNANKLHLNLVREIYDEKWLNSSEINFF